MTKKLVTFYLDSKIFDRFRKYCSDNGLIMSKRVEKLIEKETD